MTPSLASLQGVNVTLDGTGELAVSQWQSLTDGSIDVTGGDYAPTAGAADVVELVHEPRRHRRLGLTSPGAGA